MFVNIHLRVRVCAVLSCAVPPPVVLSILGQAEQSRAGANSGQLLGDVTFRDSWRLGREAVCCLDDPE